VSPSSHWEAETKEEGDTSDTNFSGYEEWRKEM
jgi:hypothetical protein